MLIYILIYIIIYLIYLNILNICPEVSGMTPAHGPLKGGGAGNPEGGGRKPGSKIVFRT